MNSRIAVIEYVTASPHLEISLEAAFEFANNGYEVDYFHLADSLPFRDFQRVIPFIGANILDRLKAFVTNRLPPHKLAINLAKSEAQQLGLRINFIEIKNLNRFSSERAISLNDDLETIKQWSSISPYMGVGVANSLIGVARDPYPNPANFKKVLKRIVKTYGIVHGWCDELFSKNQHSKVVIFNGRFAVPRAIQDSAYIHNLEIYFHERGGSDNLGFFCENFSPHGGDKLIEWINTYWQKDYDFSPSETVEIARSIFSPEERGKSITGKSFISAVSLAWENSPMRPKPNMGRLRIAYFSSSDDEFGCLGPLTPKSTFKDQRVSIIRLVELAEILDFDLVIRVHPNLNVRGGPEKDWWDDNPNFSNAKNVYHIKSTDKIDSYEILKDMDAIISWHSTLGIEAIYEGKPSINLSESHYYLAGATVDFPKNEDELISLLTNKQFISQDVSSVYPYSLSTQRSRKLYRYYKPIDAFHGEFMGHVLNK